MMRKTITLFSMIIFFIFFDIPSILAAGGETVAEGGAPPYYNWLALASGLSIGIAAFGGALSQGNAVSSALKGIARNPEASGKITTPMIIGLALIESLVIYALLIAFFLQGKIK